MPAAAIPATEAARLSELRSYEVLDQACDISFDNIASLAAQLTGCPAAVVNLIDADRQVSMAAHGLPVGELPRGLSFCSHAILTPDQMMVVPDARADERFADNPLVSGPPNVTFYAGVPLVNPQGAALGALCVVDTAPRDISESQRAVLRQLAQTVMTTLELRRAMNRIRTLSLTDTLTGLANRAALLDGLDRAIAVQRRAGTPFALVYLDLDGFKKVNDLEGHAAGDAVLRGVAQVLSARQREGDLAARPGGDEFALLLAGATPELSLALATELAAAIAGSPAARARGVTASVGVVSFVTPPSDLDHALAAADELMYEAKLAGKNRVAHREHAVTTVAPVPSSG
ncbi:GGDEF domain-containing protein [Roseomonas sp. USHLN139]|uniref:GGDEF domain-containing protein n=1 Tax=Roseomonas sp. USHLN139 TaxID=3081298 RepID=UPI003B01904D